MAKKKELSPYSALNRDYFAQPRDVCVVDEINPLPGEAAEVFVFPPADKEIDWMIRVMRGLGKPFIMEYTGEDKHRRSRFVLRQGRFNEPCSNCGVERDDI